MCDIMAKISLLEYSLIGPSIPSHNSRLRQFSANEHFAPKPTRLVPETLTSRRTQPHCAMTTSSWVMLTFRFVKKIVEPYG